VRAYVTVLSARMRLLLQYRAAAVAGFATQMFWGLIRMMIFVAFYEAATGPMPMNIEQTVTYIWLGQAFLLLGMIQMDWEIQGMIVSGNVVYELLRPIDLGLFWFARCLAGRISPVLLRAGPLLLIATLAGWVHWPRPLSVACAAASLCGATLLSASLGVLMSVTTFWTIAGQGAMRVLGAVSYVMGGLIIPLPLFPDAWQGVINFLPFRGLGDVPFRFFTANLGPSELPALLAHQLVWTIALLGISRYLIHRGLRRLVVQGG
jgi:ABC-2 type transport system permease protein